MASKVLAGRYELFEKIGEGGMSVVYKAKDRLLNRFVAIKVLKPEFIKDRKFIESFRRESQAAASLSHPNIVNIFDVGQEGNIHYIVMELIDGRTLNELIRDEGPLPYTRVIEITKQIAAALSVAHKNQLIHRDIKPHNVMMTADGTAKITDFGIAKAINSSTLADTIGSGGVMGSVHYFSPEQARGGYVDEKSDIYSLGIVMYEMLTGRVPFDGDNPVNIALMHINSEMVPPSKLMTGIPPALERIVMKATDKYQSNRFVSADELIKALNGLEFVGNVVGDSVFAADAGGEPILENTIDDDDDFDDEPKKKKKKAKKDKKADMTEEELAAAKKKKIIIGSVIGAVVLLGIILGIVFGGGEPATVPDLTGLTYEEAEVKADEVGFKIEQGDLVNDPEIEAGCVVSQTPEGNSTAKTGTTIKVNISKGPGNGQIPDVTGMDEDDAVELLEANGFKIGDITPGPSDMEKGKVYDQSPRGNTTAKEGTEVDLMVSDGSKEKVSMPSLVGEDIDDAKEALAENGLKLGSVSYESSNAYSVNEVIWQQYRAGEEIAKGTSVKLTVSTGPEAAQPVDLYISYGSAENEVFYMTVTLSDNSGTRSLFNNVERHKGSSGETITLTGTGNGTVVVTFDGKQVMKKSVNFTKGTIR